jgi:hypothetical protein
MKIETIIRANCSEWNQYLEDDFFVDDSTIEEIATAAKKKAESEDWDGDNNRG